tara:strand:+ start:22338 stop:24419 length:2082 start_codon:yes stop_codon:yes gene_type:complete
MDIENKELDLGRLFRQMLMQSKLILLLTAIFSSLIIYQYLATERIFQVKSLLMVKSTMNSADPTNLNFLLGGGGTSTELSSQSRMYLSRNNIGQAIENLNRNVDFYDSKSLDLIEITDFQVKEKRIIGQDFFFELKSGQIRLLDAGSNAISDWLASGATFDNGDLSFTANVLSFDNAKEKFSFRNTTALIPKYSGKITVAPLTNNRYIVSSSGLLEITMLTSSVSAGKLFLEQLNKVFIENDLNYQAKKANNAVVFIDENIDDVTEILRVKKDNLTNFQETNISVNFELETAKILESVSVIEANLDALELEKSMLLNQYTEDSPQILTLQERQNILKYQKQEIESRIKELPASQQAYFDLFREVEATEKLYTNLMDSRLTYSLLEASTIGSIDIVEHPYAGRLVTPRLIYTLLSLLLGFFFSIGVGLLRANYFTPITNPAELADENVENSILGVIPFITESDKEKFESSCESLILNLMKIIDSRKTESSNIVALTSALPSNGKTTISSNLAQALSDLNKKVLLIDCDFKRGNIHDLHKINKISEADFKSLDTSNLERFKVKENLYIIPRISKLRSSFNYINDPKNIEIMKRVFSEFDHVIIDTAPILAVADTGIILSLADIRLLVVRHNMTRINQIKQAISIANQIGIDFDGILYNAYSKPKGYYGYYGAYQNYEYQYYADKYLYEKYDYERD